MASRDQGADSVWFEWRVAGTVSRDFVSHTEFRYFQNLYDHRHL